MPTVDPTSLVPPHQTSGERLPVIVNGSVIPPPVDSAPKPTLAQAPPTAPADLVPHTALRNRVAWYAGTLALTVIILFAGLRLDAIDLHAPLEYDRDVLLILPMVKATLERGFGGHWRNERLGYPGIQELHDFPVIDHLHFAIIWVLGKVLPDCVVVYNAYFLLTWPITALTAMFALRVLKLTLPMAAVGGLLFAFTPYHYLRGENHFFLAAYWMIPLTWLPALAICQGNLPFFRRLPCGRYQPALLHLATLWQVLLAAATASAGAYYAFFACAIYGFIGVYAWVAGSTWKAAASAAVLIGLVGGFGVVNHMPAFAFEAEHGKNSATVRDASEAEFYGLKIAQLILPTDGHNVTLFSQIKCRYNDPIRLLNNENSCSTLGLIGSVGLMWLLISLLLPIRRGWPHTPLAAIVGFIILYATVGGFSSVFNLLVFDQVRCPNRLSIYLVFICLFAALWPLDRFLVTRTGWARRLRYPAIAAMALLGIIDQTPTAWFTSDIVEFIQKDADRFKADRRFFGQIDEWMPSGSKIFMVPYITYPETPPRFSLGTYEHIRGYLLTNGLVLSYGGVKNREADMWYEQVAHRSRDELLRRVVVRGFDGLFVDKRGFEIEDGVNLGDTFITDIKHLAEGNGGVKLPTFTHEDGWQVFLDLRPYRDWLKKENPNGFAAWEKEEQEWCTITWLQGFFSNEPPGLRDRHRWVTKSALAVIVNPSDRTRTFVLAATFGVDSMAGEFQIDIDGGGLRASTDGGDLQPWHDEFTIQKRQEDADANVRAPGVRKTYRIEVPPGRHRVNFRATPPRKFMPSDAHSFCYSLKDIVFIEAR